MAMAKGQLEVMLKDEHDLISRGVLREENPLDQSQAFNQFLEACRRGDLRTCQEAISAGVNINGKDAFDYTPLIIASLCGHYEVAQLLLESGALAERNTFQGERCLHNALNDRIRNLLLQYDYAKSTHPLQPWASYITSLLTREVPKTSDITLTAAGGGSSSHGGDHVFQLHKFLLAARTPYFRRKLSEAPGMDTWRLSSSTPPAAFRFVLRYLYLDDLMTQAAELTDGDGDDDQVFRAIDKISRHLEVQQLWEALPTGSDRRLARQRYEDEVERAHLQVSAFFQKHVLQNKMVVDAAVVDNVKWPHDNFIFADCLLRADEVEEQEEEEEEGGEGGEEGEAERRRTSSIPIGPAIGTAAEPPAASSSSSSSTPHRPRAVLYPVHKALLVRSPYFAAMFSSAFIEAQVSEHLRIVSVDCAPEVLEIVLAFLYTEKADIPLALALDVLYTADMLLLDKLKNKAAVAISTLGHGGRSVLTDPTHAGVSDADHPDTADDINVYDVMRAAWDLNVQRLETFAARFLAERLEHYIDAPAFANLVLESAHRLTDRQETDTIELVDDIRYFLSERFRLRFEDVAMSDIMDDQDGQDKEGRGEEEKGDADKAETDNVASVDVKTDNEAEARPGVIRTLDGATVEDEFDSDAQNYQILLLKIDKLLERLGLDG